MLLLWLWGTKMPQKFKRGDEVVLTPAEMERVRWLIGDASRVMVEYSYRDQFGGGRDGSRIYSLSFYNRKEQTNRISWFDENKLTLKKKRTIASIAFLEAHEDRSEE